MKARKKFKNENNNAAVYVGSSLTVHKAFFFVPNLCLNKFKRCFYWSENCFKMIGMLLNVVHGHVQRLS